MRLKLSSGVSVEVRAFRSLPIPYFFEVLTSKGWYVTHGTQLSPSPPWVGADKTVYPVNTGGSESVPRTDMLPPKQG